jgi:predicted amidohydrolase YtcJ
MSYFDLLIKNGTIITMDKALSKKRWLAVKDGIISAVGDRDDFCGEAKEIIDLDGKALMPGLIDAHVHSTLTGIGKMGIDLAGINTVNGILDAVGEFCAKDPSDKVVYGFNMSLAKDMVGKKLPDRFELDAVTGNHPIIMLFWTVHGGILNSKAMEHIASTNAAVYVDENGFFNEDYPIGHILNLFPDEDFENLFMDIANECASKGITTVHSMDGMWVKDDRDTDILMRILNTLPIEFRPYTQTFDWQKIRNYGLKQIGGCITIDGSPPQLTAAYSEPYRNAPHTRGLLNYSDKELYEFVKAATKEGMQVAFHAIGDRAIDQVIYIYQQVDREIGIRHLRHRIEHLSFPTDRATEMVAEMNVPAIMQPALANMLDGPKENRFEFQVSKEKAIRHENFAMRMKAGVKVANGSDSPAAPLDGFIAINAAVNMHNPERRVSLDDALKMCTINAAWAGHQEDRIGSLEVSKEADFIVLDKDPYALPTGADLTQIVVEETYKKGKRIFKKAM